MNRKQFVLAQGATCDNWTWSWSFVNHKEKFVIFGAWDRHTDGNAALILKDSWASGDQGKRAAGYKQSREHIRLIEEEGYALRTFPIKYSDERKDKDGAGPAKIAGFEPVLSEKILKRVGNCWYAFDGSSTSLIPEEVDSDQPYIEGASQSVVVNSFERNSKARKKCIEHHGCMCVVCGFRFDIVYGSIGENYIHVHHVIPLSEIRREYKLDPIKDLIPICPNCHAMIHRTRPALTVDQLKQYLNEHGHT
jgi:5-methylcytosine-specific restriction enzyme A